MFFADTIKSLRRPGLWLFTTFFRFLIRYRRTVIGPLWIIATPLLFIFFLGALFVGLSNFSTSEFIPHLSIGLVVWTLLGGYLSRSPSLFARNKAYLLQGKANFTDILFIDNAELIVHFSTSMRNHCWCVWFFTARLNLLIGFCHLFGLAIVILNGYWLSFVFAFIGARFGDFREIVSSFVRIAFLATPIIWMPVRGDTAVGGSGGVLQIYMDYNPLYHFLELIRAPLLNNPIAPLSWYVTISITVVGWIFASFIYSRSRYSIVTWV